MFSCEYSGIFKKTYFEEHLQTAASGLSLLIIEKHRRCLFIACHHLKIYCTISCVQISLNCDEENMFFMKRLFSVAIFGLCVWFRTSLFWTSAQNLFWEFGKCLEKYIFWTPTNCNSRKKFVYSKHKKIIVTKIKPHLGIKLIWPELSCISFTRISVIQDR